MKKHKLNKYRRSNHKKMNSIYSKAERMIKEKWETPDLNESSILKMVSKYPSLSVRVLINGSVEVISKRDRWLIVDDCTYYTLYHKTTDIVRNKVVERQHVQDVFYDLDFIFASIVSHDEYKISKKKTNISDIIREVCSNESSI